MKSKKNEIKDLKKNIKINEEFINSMNMKVFSTISEKLIPKIDFSKVIPDYNLIFKKMVPDYASIFKNLIDAISNFPIKFKKEFPWLDFFSLSYAFELGEVLEKEGREKVFENLYEGTCKKEFENYLKKALKEDLYKNRKKIILKGYESHKKGDFISSISVLTPQIEGIIWDLGIKEGIVEDKEGSKKIIDIKKRVIHKIKGKKIEWDLKGLMIHLFGDKDPKKEFYEKELYKNLRNPLMHGRLINFDTKENSVTCILFIVALIEKIKEIKNEK